MGKKLLNQQYSCWTGVLGTLWISSTHLVHTGTVGISLYTSWGWYVSNWTQVTHITSFLIGYPLCGTLCSVTLIGFAVRTMRPLVSILPPSLLTTSTKRWKLTFTREYWVGEWALWKLLSLKSYLLDLYQTSEILRTLNVFCQVATVLENIPREILDKCANPIPEIKNLGPVGHGNSSALEIVHTFLYYWPETELVIHL